jgi:SAM-dependent methyltransferase
MSAVLNQAAIQPHNAKPAATWSAPGELYDDISRGISGAINHGVDRLQTRPGDRVLDLACGTGWASREVARRAPGAKITGCDIAHGLLDAARAIAKRERLDIGYELGDAEQLPYADGAFDALISTFGVMFASNPGAAAAELARVVRKGGRLALVVWQPECTLFQMFQVMKPYLPVPPKPMPSPFAWGNRDRVRELLAKSFDLRFEEGLSPFLAPSAEDAWELWTANYGPSKMLATTLPADRREQFKADMIAFHRRFATELGVLMPRDYLVAVGVKK